MMKDRIHQEAEKGKKRRFRTEVCKREISYIYSRGTYFNPNTSEDSNSTFDTQYILVFHFNSETDEFGFTFFDISELKFYVGSFVDDTVMSKFRTLISRIRPVEIVGSDRFRYFNKMVNGFPVKPSFSFIKDSDFHFDPEGRDIIEVSIQHEERELPIIIEEMLSSENDNDLVIISLGNAFNYLESLKIAEVTLKLSEFFRYDHDSPTDYYCKHLIMDSQALENLEVFEVEAKNGKTTEGSLFSFLNKCTTKFGSRMLK